MSWVADNWPIIAGFGAGLIAWGKTVADVGANKKAIAAHVKELTDQRSVVVDISKAVAKIEIHNEYTRQAIEGIRRDLHDERKSRE